MGKRGLGLIAGGVIFAVVVGLAAFKLGSRRPAVREIIPDPTPIAVVSPDPTVQQIAPEETAMAFYANYEDCLKNPPAVAAGRVSTYCRSRNPFITAAFVANLAQGGIASAGADPIVCAQNFPTGFNPGIATISGNLAKVEVTENFGGVENIKTLINLLQENGSWKVDKIICPKP